MAKDMLKAFGPRNVKHGLWIGGHNGRFRE